VDIQKVPGPPGRGARCNSWFFQEDWSQHVGGARPRRIPMLVNLHLWEAPVRNLDWVTSAFGYR